MSEPAMGGYVTGLDQLPAHLLDRTHYLTAAQVRAAGLTVASDE